jgi:CRISPR-associated endonuclease/helicase Cas3
MNSPPITTTLLPDLRFWGKARPTAAASPDHHPLCFHSLDVAAVGLAYLQTVPRVTKWLAARLGTQDSAALESWITFWLALHDLGKFSHSFQAQCPELVKHLLGHCPERQDVHRHDSLGAVWVDEHLLDIALEEGWFAEASIHGLMPWVQANCGHHGQPPLGRIGNLLRHWEQQNSDAALSFSRQMRHLLLTPEAAALPQLTDWDTRSQRVSWWIAGLAVLADWLGSNTRYFPYCTEAIPLDSYWQRAQAQAAAALKACGVLPHSPVQGRSFQALFPTLPRPSPLQAWAAGVELPPGPQLFILEDVTGAGKTEAALTLVHRLMAGGQADGFFVGLPTMATAHALYGRVAASNASLFGDAWASLALATGSRDMVEAFTASVLPADSGERDQRLAEMDTASSRCEQWLADHNKRALLAPAAVGTIDQALLAVLKSKHQSLRLLGLAGKVLVIDEVHACDAYMIEVLEQLLEFHAFAGGSALLLSATLTEQMKSRLVSAFAAGCGADLPAWQAQPDYPLTTAWAASQPSALRQTPMPTRPDVARSLQVRYLHDRALAQQDVARALRHGQCAAWICNSVVDALQVHADMAELIPAEQITLFHARFALGDRLDIEEDVLRRFGPASTPELRRGRLLIATQVAEQSLDFDADLLLTELAPIDRVIQRAGRLRRHRRDSQGTRLADASQPDGRGPACLWVLGPPWADEPAADWLRRPLPRTGRVYENHAQLWLSARALQGGEIHMPADARRLIEGVFGPDADEPPGLQRSAMLSMGRVFADASEARQNVVKLELGYERGAMDWNDDTVAPTRLGEATREVLLARWDGGALKPWREHPTHPWAYSSVKVAQRLIDSAVPPTDATRRAAWDATLAGLPGGGRGQVLLALDEQQCGLVMPLRGEPALWHYDSTQGLRALPASKGHA